MDWVTLVSLVIICGATVILANAWIFSESPEKSLSLEIINAPDKQSLSASNYGENTAAMKSGPSENSNYSQAHANTKEYVAKVVDLLGISIQLRELREAGEQTGEGAIRNVEFFIRDGIVPRRLFSDGGQVITHYWPLYHNNVGYGATTVRVLFQYVAGDSNGDGRLDGEDRQSLAMSLPDGSHFRVLERDAGEVVDMTYLSDLNELQVQFITQGSEERRIYSLAAN